MSDNLSAQSSSYFNRIISPYKDKHFRKLLIPLTIIAFASAPLCKCGLDIEQKLNIKYLLSRPDAVKINSLDEIFSNITNNTPRDTINSGIVLYDVDCDGRYDVGIAPLTVNISGHNTDAYYRFLLVEK